MKKVVMAAALVAAFSFSFATAAFAQNPPPPTEERGAAQLAVVVVPARNAEKLTVTSPAFNAGGDIPFENTQYRTNIFPGLSWTPGPSGTTSYVIIMQDTDAIVRGAPILHWTMVNIPSTITKLDAGMTALPAGSSNGPNIRGENQAYMGPRTPPGPKHRYHFQVFALDTSISPEAAKTYDGLIAAMKDHVLVSGEIVGLGQAPTQGN